MTIPTAPRSPPAGGSALVPTPQGIRLRVRVKPGASRQAVIGRTRLPGGEAAVAIAVSAAPEGGKANDAVAALLAKTWGLPKTSIAIRVGASSRTKILQVAGDPDILATRLSAWLETLPEI
ncbi:MAG TPA: DUF167 family protein [Aliidongia sp.]|uniref:DUF167 family protein n=1 Tax=Aliidongia sp. TaxID=1914230 RepID=UPI002DDC9162|nr:DUF167 family protein [Aliidongia sp.]HEV2673079.1 DUF167 family protein [Aliidongia sp.]